jgi:L-amino acid N-acyltransferase YncA
MKIRPVRREDAGEMLDIYRPFITDNCVSFELEPPTLEQFAERIDTYTKRFPWLVAEENGEVIGYAYASSYRERKAYQWSVECSVYIRADKRGTGCGRILYESLFADLIDRGFFNVYAIITLPNDASVQFHRSMNFEEVGIFKRVGFKFDAWHDVLWMVKFLKEGTPSEELKIENEK